MRISSISFALLTLIASPAAAQEHAARGLLEPAYGLMVWTLVIFVILGFLLSKFAFGPITAAVEAREKALEDAIDSARRDREEAARLLAEHRAALNASRGEAQQIIMDARTAGERVRAELLEHAHIEQASMIERARTEIEFEKARAVTELRREAVDLAILGAGKVIEKNLDQASNRALVESFLASITPEDIRASR